MVWQTGAFPSTPRSGSRKILWTILMTVLWESYRPELHYMRGPGPKWHERQDRLRGRASRPDHP
jgi:hypothetical protein